MSKKNSIVLKIVVLSVLAFMLIGFMFLCLYFSFNHRKFNIWNFFGSNEYKLVKSETYNINDIKSVNFDLTSADIDIKYSDSGDVKLDLYDKEEDYVSVSVNNGTLDVHYNKVTDFCIGFCFGSRRVVLYLPQSFEGDIKVKTASGDVNVLDFRNSNMIINTVSGDISISGVKDANIESTSGEIRVNNVNDIKVNTRSGDIEIIDVNNISGDTTSGSLEVYRLKNSIDFSSISGDIDLSDVNLNQKSRLSTVSGDVEIERINLVNIVTSTVSGDTEIYSSDRYSNIELSIKTTSGDIEVK